MLTDEQQQAAEKFANAAAEYINVMYCDGDDDDLYGGAWHVEMRSSVAEVWIRVCGIYGGGTVFNDVYDRMEHNEATGEGWRAWRCSSKP